MEIEIGEYVRTSEEGYIGKLIKINREHLNYYQIDVGREIKRTNGYSDNYIYSRDGFGLKHSKDIINLIEEGDYVNGEYVAVIEKDKEGNITDICYEEENEGQLYSIGDIKSIVTKEQFSQMEYKLEE